MRARSAAVLAAALALLSVGGALGQTSGAPTTGAVPLARLSFLENSVYVRAEGSRVYHVGRVEGYGGHSPTRRVIRVVDAADPDQARVVGSYDFEGVGTVVLDLRVRDGYGYVATGPAGGNLEARLRVLDLRDPARPTQVGNVDFRRDGRFPSGFWPAQVALDGAHAYVASSGSSRSSLAVVDVGRPEAPSVVGSLDLEEGRYASGLAAAGGHVFVTDDLGSLRVVDASDPTRPAAAASLALGGAVHALAAQPPYLYALVRPAADAAAVELVTVDVADPRQPRVAARSAAIDVVSIAETGARLSVAGRYAHVAAGTAGVVVFDLADPARPVGLTVTTAAGHALDVAAVGDLLAVAAARPTSSPGGGVALLRFPAAVWRLRLPLAGQPANPLWRTRAAPAGESFGAASFADARVGWAIGGTGRILATTDGGATWTEQSSGTTAALRDVAAASPSVAWAVGAGGTLLKTEDGGATWRSQASGTTGDLRALDAVSPTVAWAIGSEGGDPIMVRTTDGATWVARRTAAPLSEIDAVDATTAWAISLHAVHWTRDGGATWASHPGHPDSGSLVDVAAGSADAAWAVAAGGQSEAVVLHTADGGATFALQRTGTVADLTGGTAASPSVAWLAGGASAGGPGVLLVTTDGGATWRPEEIGQQPRLDRVDALSPSVAWATAGGTLLVRDPAR